MSNELADFAAQFSDGKVSAVTLSDEYIERWKKERDQGRLLQDPAAVSEALSTIFCFADLYNPEPDREEYEFDEERLCREVKSVLSKMERGTLNRA